MMDITFRRDPNNFRPRINKMNSRKDQEQKLTGDYFLVETMLNNMQKKEEDDSEEEEEERKIEPPKQEEKKEKKKSKKKRDDSEEGFVEESKGKGKKSKKWVWTSTYPAWGMKFLEKRISTSKVF